MNAYVVDAVVVLVSIVCWTWRNHLDCTDGWTRTVQRR